MPFSDLGLAVRHLLRAPGFTIAATATLAIGANSAIFSAVNSVLIHPPVQSIYAWQVALVVGLTTLGLCCST